MKHPSTVTPADEALLRRTLTSGLSDDEHALFLRTCNRSGLDPFARQIYICRDGAELRFLATIDGFRVAAERTGKYAGQFGPHWCGPDGKWLKIWTAKEPPTAARIGVLRSDFKAPVWGKAIYSEFSQGGEFWQGMPCNQLAKCAEALAFRKAFPKVFSGLYTSEEFSSARRSRLSSVAPANAEQGNVIVLPVVSEAPVSRPSRVPLQFAGASGGDKGHDIQESAATGGKLRRSAKGVFLNNSPELVGSNPAHQQPVSSYAGIGVDDDTQRDLTATLGVSGNPRQQSRRSFGGSYPEGTQTGTIAGSIPACQQSIPLPLQPFLEKGFSDRENVSACWEFIRGELRAALGDSGQQIWATVYRGALHLYPSREAHAREILARWLELWGYLDKAKGEAA